MGKSKAAGCPLGKKVLQPVRLLSHLNKKGGTAAKINI